MKVKRLTFADHLKPNAAAEALFAALGSMLLVILLIEAVVAGVASALLTLLAGYRYVTGKVFGISGLLIHAVLLGSCIYGLASIHSYLAKTQQVPLRQAARYSSEMQDRQRCPSYFASSSFSKYSFE